MADFLLSIGVEEFEYVFLNAGVLGPISKAVDLPLSELESCFQINVVAAKQVLDCLFTKPVTLKNVVAISSGAANKAYDGWLSYCLTKAALKQMISCYAVENTDTHFVSLSPGPVKTKMQEALLREDATKFRSLQKFHDIYDNLDSSDVVAEKIFKELPFNKGLESGSFTAIK